MSDFEAIVVGAGFGGMGVGIQLDRSGVTDWVIVDREDDLGGTWHVNRYPGLAVDIASVTYSFSFEPNPRWSRMFAPGPELKRYAEHVADRYDLRRRMRFGHTVEGARWDEDEQHWVVSFRDQEPLTARILIAATGFLSQPKLPDIEGIDDFEGQLVHTAKWPDEIELAGRRTAVIGTGATAVQLIPELAKEVDHLTVFQRTPIWVTPKFDRRIPGAVQELFAKAPLTQRAARLANTAMLETITALGVVHYRRTGVVNRLAERAAKAHIRAQVKDPETQRKLTPTYRFGCKRPTFSNDYLRTFNKAHVDLVTSPITHIEADAVVTADGVRHEVDLLVCATGYSLWEKNFPAVEVLGRDGVSLTKTWREGGYGSYEGISVPGFPNFFSLMSPYSYTGLSFFWTIESQMVHMERVLAEVDRRGASVFEPREEAAERFTERSHRRIMEESVFGKGDCASANSYYFAPDGTPALLRPQLVAQAFREQGRFPLDDYAYA